MYVSPERWDLLLIKQNSLLTEKNVLLRKWDNLFWKVFLSITEKQILICQIEIITYLNSICFQTLHTSLFIEFLGKKGGRGRNIANTLETETVGMNTNICNSVPTLHRDQSFAGAVSKVKKSLNCVKAAIAFVCATCKRQLLSALLHLITFICITAINNFLYTTSIVNFLDDGRRLYRWCCRSVGRSVGWSVGLQKILKNKKDEVLRVI